MIPARNLIQVVHLLGPSWAFFRLIQAVRARTGYWERKTPRGQWGRERRVFKGQFLNMQFVGDLSRQVRDIFKGKYWLFSRHKVQAGFVPDWFAGYFAGQNQGAGYTGKAHWSKIPDFASNRARGVRS